MYNNQQATNGFGQFGPAHADNSAVALDFGGAVEVSGGNAFDRPSFTILPEGDYNFTVKDVSIKDYDGSAKLPPCKCLVVNMMIDGGDAGIGSCRYNIYLVNKNARRLRDFLACVGKISPDTHNFTLSPTLLDVSNLSGRGHFTTRDYGGKTYQDFRYALPAEDKQGQALPF